MPQRVMEDGVKALDRVSLYISRELDRMVLSGREQVEMAEKVGLKPSALSQHRHRKNGVAKRYYAGYATLFGLGSAAELERRAYEEDQRDTWKASPLLREAATRRAAEAVAQLRHVDRTRVDAILTAFAHPRFLGRDERWWTRTLLDELDRDLGN